jgi:7-carboxy-7-deazaguanine synthase (Cx14CxxC type)
MTYAVKEIIYTLQGEGANSGHGAVFCRFSGCNLWSGREEDRATAICRFCDTDFVGTDGEGGGQFSSEVELAEAINNTWNADPGSSERPLVVFTGGEPLLQLDEALIKAVHSAGFLIAVETNGTLVPPPGIDWICVSPKAGAILRLRAGNELKLVYPQVDAPPEAFDGMAFDHFFLQPMAGPSEDRNRRLSVEYCLRHPKWRLSIQLHKVVGIP